jgi:hypothetical protein
MPQQPRDPGQRATMPRGEVVRWRRAQLLRTGFQPWLAASVAHEGAIDLHALIELVERGCPPALAVRILAPLDHGRGSR